MPPLPRRFLVLASLFLVSALSRSAWCEPLPSPETHLGHRVGADFQLPRWDTIRAYFEKVGKLSNRVRIQVLGSSTEGRKMVMAIISSPETIARLSQHQQEQHRLADPRLLGDR